MDSFVWFIAGLAVSFMIESARGYRALMKHQSKCPHEKLILESKETFFNKDFKPEEHQVFKCINCGKKIFREVK